MTPEKETDPQFFVVAIDGGAASGKSTTSRALAERRHLLHVDTGSHYRAVTLACLKAGKSKLAKIPIMAITIKSSIKVKRFFFINLSFFSN